MTPTTNTDRVLSRTHELNDYRPITLQVTESADGTGKVRVRGEFARCDLATQNGRVYSRSLFEREVGRMSKDLGARKVFGELDHPCIQSPDFRVLSVDGWKEFRDIRVGDRVWSRVGGEAVLSTVREIVDQPYDGPVYRVRGRNIDTAFTPAHKFLLLKRPDGTAYADNSEVYATVAEIDQNRGGFRHSAIPKTALWRSESLATVELPAFRAERGRFTSPVEQVLQLDARVFAAFMGLYLSEGCCGTQEHDYEVQICQKTAWSKQYLYSEVLSKFPTDVVWREIPDGYATTDARLHAYVKPLGDCYSKYVPSEVKKLDSECLREFVFWYTIGDGRMIDASPAATRLELRSGTFKESAAAQLRSGTLPNTRQDVFSVSERLIRDLHECVVKSGGAGSLTTVLPDRDYAFADRVIRAENKVPLHQLHISQSAHIWLDPRFLSIEEEHHTGNIYCLGVTNGNFYMEQNGKSFWTGNSDGRTLLTRVSHVITSLEVQEDGTVIGEAEILDTSRGQDLKALLKSGCSVGVSSRGTGSTKTTKEGKEEVQEDYRLGTFDFVAEPADQTAYPKTFFESVDGKLPEGVTLEQALRAAEEAASVKVENQLRHEFAAKLPLLIERLKSDLRVEVEAQLLADPAIAGAKTALEQVKQILRPFVLPDDIEKTLSERDAELVRLRNAVASRDLKIRELEDDGVKLEALARTTGHKYFVERAIHNNVDAEIIRAALGDLGAFESLDALKLKLESIQAELVAKQKLVAEEAERVAAAETARVDKAKADAAALEAITAQVRADAEAEKVVLLQRLEVAEATAAAARATVLSEARSVEAEQAQLLQEERAARKAAEAKNSERIEDLQEALAKAVAANKIQALTAHVERKIAGNPKASEIRLALNETINEDTTRVEIDEFIETFPVETVNEDPDNLRSRVRRLTRGGRQPGALIEETKGTPTAKGGRSDDDSDYQGLGTDIGTIRKLSGLG